MILDFQPNFDDEFGPGVSRADGPPRQNLPAVLTPPRHLSDTELAQLIDELWQEGSLDADQMRVLATLIELVRAKASAPLSIAAE